MNKGKASNTIFKWLNQNNRMLNAFNNIKDLEEAEKKYSKGKLNISNRLPTFIEKYKNLKLDSTVMEVSEAVSKDFCFIERPHFRKLL